MANRTEDKKFARGGNLRPPVKTYGGKWYLRHWLISNFPKQYRTYVEPFCGGSSVFFNKPISSREIVSDIDFRMISVLLMLRDRFQEFENRLRSIPYTEESFENAKQLSTSSDILDIAVAEFALRRMSRGGSKSSFAWSKRYRGGKPGDVNAWETILNLLPQHSERLQKTEIYNAPYEEMILEDHEDAFFYLDPPYLQETRSSGSIQIYDFEMDREDHIAMIELCKQSKHKIMISGYQSKLYMDELKDWNMSYRMVANHASQKDRKMMKIETIWMNY